MAIRSPPFSPASSSSGNIRLLKRSPSRLRYCSQNLTHHTETTANSTPIPSPVTRTPILSPENRTPIRSPGTPGLLDRIRLLKKSETGDLDTSVQSHVGTPAKLRYFHSYRNLRKVTDSVEHYRLPKDALTEYLVEVEKSRMAPEPMGMVKRRGREDEIDISQYRAGDRRAIALSKGIGCLPKLSKLNMSWNHLSDKGANLIIQNLSPHSTTHLDLSYNTLSTIESLGKLCEQPNSHLEVLNLEGNKLREQGLSRLLKSLSVRDSLKELNLARTHLSDLCAVPVSAYLKDSQNLQKLDLHWNIIRSTGGVALFRGLAENKGLREMDISWNALGHPTEAGIGTVISKAFREHQTLFHVDLSHNQLSVEDCKRTNVGLSENHSIAGLHLEGNEGGVDALGFVWARSGCYTPKDAHVFNRILGKGRRTEVWRPGSNCWICEGWTEVEFEYTSHDTEESNRPPVYLHLDFEGFEPYLMPLEGDGKFQESRMCPPGQVRFFYTQNNEQKVVSDKQKETLPQPFTGPVSFSGANPALVNVSEVNVITVQKSSHLLSFEESSLKAKPRPQKRWFSPEVKKPHFWSIPISVFKDYKFETEDLLYKCFMFDWENSKLPKLVKNPEELEVLKSLLWKHYKGFRETYKHYSCFSPQGFVWSIAQNAFTDLCTQCNLTESMNLSDIDFQFKASNYSAVKTNPRNPANALIRCQFMEIFVRIAGDKYVKTRIVRSIGQAMERLIKEHLETEFAKYDSNKWRWDRYLNEDCDIVFKTYLPVLQHVFKAYSGKYIVPGQKPFMSPAEFQSLCTAASLLNETFTARDYSFCFNLSMMTQVDELNFDRHFQMCFVEFLEALGRVAELGKYAGDAALLHDSLKEVMKRLAARCPKQVQDQCKKPVDDDIKVE